MVLLNKTSKYTSLGGHDLRNVKICQKNPTSPEMEV